MAALSCSECVEKAQIFRRLALQQAGDQGGVAGHHRTEKEVGFAHSGPIRYRHHSSNTRALNESGAIAPLGNGPFASALAALGLSTPPATR